ncbi:Hypothetical predicted protein, partial [Paramuricea clavata]
SNRIRAKMPPFANTKNELFLLRGMITNCNHDSCSEIASSNKTLLVGLFHLVYQ